MARERRQGEQAKQGNVETSGKPHRSGLPLLAGRAGEHFVAAELLRRGIIASLTPMNAPMFDILASNGSSLVRVRVKTMSAERAEMWQWSVKEEIIFPGLKPRDREDFTVLVRLKEATERPEFYVVSTWVLWQQVKKERKEYIKRRGKPTGHYGLRYPRWAGWLEQFRDAWDTLWQA